MSILIRRSTSYIAWKIFELTGKYPLRFDQERYDAKDWVEFLTEAGYGTIVSRPERGHHYVGVMPKEGEFGQLVWLGKIGREVSQCDTELDQRIAISYSDGKHTFKVLSVSDDNPQVDYFCSTYRNFEFEIVRIEHDFKDIIWVQID